MELIGKITDIDIGEKIKEISQPKKRIAVRTILFNKEGKIALLHKSKKNEYKLVGGGVDKGEDLQEALERETMEETGCKVKIISEYGYIEECRSRDNFVQTSYVYITQVIEDTHHLKLTDAESEEGAKLCWYDIKEALERISKSYDILIPSKYSDIYNTKFIIKRDEKILSDYIAKQN